MGELERHPSFSPNERLNVSTKLSRTGERLSVMKPEEFTYFNKLRLITVAGRQRKLKPHVRRDLFFVDNAEQFSPDR